MDSLIDDIIVYVTNFLNDREKILFLSSTNRVHLLKNKVYYNENVYVDKIKDVPYYDMFTNVSIGDLCHKLPKAIVKITFDRAFNEDINGYIPNSVTHITFGSFFNRDIKGCIPNTVTHLEFGHSFDQDIKGCIPNSVTHLRFGNKFNQTIKGNIPTSITHLTINLYFNKFEKECIPNSVTDLIFSSNNFNQNVRDCIPDSVTHLYFDRSPRGDIKDLPTSIIEVWIPRYYSRNIKVHANCKIVRW